MGKVELKNGAQVDEVLVEGVWAWILGTAELTYLFACARAQVPHLFQSVKIRDFLYERGILDADWRLDEDIIHILVSTISQDTLIEDASDDLGRFVHPRKDSEEVRQWICGVADTRVSYIPTGVEGVEIIEIDSPSEESL